MLDGIDLEDKENVASVTSVIKAVLDGVKVNSWLVIENVVDRVTFCCVAIGGGTEAACVCLCEQELVKLTIEKQEQPSPTTPNKPAPPATTAER